MDPLPSGLSDIERWAIFLSAIAAGLAAVGILGRMAVRAWRRLRRFVLEAVRRAQALEALVQHELQPNSGGSLHDKVNALRAAQAATSRTVRRNSKRLGDVESALSTLAESQRAMWPAIEAVARAEPPSTTTGEDAAT